ncbi:hypothetical protein KR054_000298 [Drosophila jambulina]|nr:hypothetical protein KR054_000298 [Drosophila jambulina]
MDISKVERQAPAEERNTKPPNYMIILLQDMICFFVLLSLAMFIVAGILYLADDVTRLQYRPREPMNVSRTVSVEESHKHMHRFLRPDTWFRLFSCQKQQDARMLQQHERSQMQEQKQEQGQLLGEGQEKGLGLGQSEKLEELDENQPFGPYYGPTYGPDNKAAGDHVVPEPVSNQLDREPKPAFEFF